MISERYPEAEFEVTTRPGIAAGPWLRVFVPENADWDVIEMTGERTTDMLISEGISIHVIPMPYDRRPSLKATGRQIKSRSA
ncbi:MAG: hypothetical protein NTZ05_16845 [Chloroflexi bacterium]|nr:hypothetical protein [Chloroflexota bacterium]